MALQTAMSPSYCHLILFTVVYNRRKTGPEFRSIERPGGHQAGLATHSSFESEGYRAEKVTGGPG